ncbi:MAG: N-carbamoylputrescine amidase [Myxococcales bacterium]|nr:N-carbamoylputrescine amidase [Myxococcales bacterium]USN50356.1 MAG: N-carbamoylputrescine amidase [Myxococcales bacterium]
MAINVGVIQSSYSDDAKVNNQKILHYIESAKKAGAQVVLPSELYLGHYFCKTQDEHYFSYAHELEHHPHLKAVRDLCKKLEVVVPWSFFEKSGPHYFNSLAMIDASGEVLGVYRKSHIPDGPGYQEKFYFRPGNTGFKVFSTKYGKMGAGICWDQWFPEAARIMTLMGAEILFYPTAIGSEPHAPWLSTKDPWQRVMKGHAVANMIPVVAANRIGNEEGQVFYGASFICDEFGSEIVSFDDEDTVKVATVDLEKAAKNRAAFGFFRDRRVDLYTSLLE